MLTKWRLYLDRCCEGKLAYIIRSHGTGSQCEGSFEEVGGNDGEKV